MYINGKPKRDLKVINYKSVNYQSYLRLSQRQMIRLVLIQSDRAKKANSKWLYDLNNYKKINSKFDKKIYN